MNGYGLRAVSDEGHLLGGRGHSCSMKCIKSRHRRERPAGGLYSPACLPPKVVNEMEISTCWEEECFAVNINYAAQTIHAISRVL